MTTQTEGTGERVLIAGEAAVGVRFDRFLGEKLGCSRAEVRRLLERGGVWLDGRPAGRNAKGVVLVGGERIEVDGYTPVAALAVRPEPGLPLSTSAKGDGWVAVEKPAGVPVHPLREEEAGTLLNALAARFPAVQGVGEGGLRSGVLHRLDVDTSGIVVFATEEARWVELRELFKRHRVEKIYRALVEGDLEGEGRLELWLRIAVHKPAHVRVSPPANRDARPTRLAWRSVERFHGATLVEVSLETGFLHQIRASFAHIGHPLLGDAAYGGPAQSAGIALTRQMLHAARLRAADIFAESPDPADLAELLARLRSE